MSDLEDELREQLASTQQKLNLCQESIKNYRPEKVKELNAEGGPFALIENNTRQAQ